jgi:L-rhamnose mutarotase
MARKEAKAAGLTTYFTGQPCREGHVAAHWTSSANCVICERASFDLAFCCNKKAPIRRTEEYRAEHQRKWRAANAEKERARVREYQIENKERYMEYQTAYQAARRVLQRKAQPPWVDVAGLRAIYRDMRRKNRKAGKIVCHVDHIVPLKGRNVCGLHVPWNLRVISARENMQKGNRFET